MRKRLPKTLVTGGAGFIGSEFVRLASGALAGNEKLIIVDKLTYAGDLERIKAAEEKYKFYKTDICDKKQIDAIFKKERPERVINFAAETHVDRSIKNASAFVETNFKGTQVLLESGRKYGIKRYIQVSTDEVYGEIRMGKFNEDSPVNPNSPYAASKAAADLLIKSYIRTYNFPAIIIRPCNNYGPWQYPEKLIPVIINKAIQDKWIPVYADGMNMREWLYVSDCAAAILKIADKGRLGNTYNVGSGCEKKNLEVVKSILGILNKPHTLIKFVKDRPGHDWRYSLDSSKILKLGWKPGVSFINGIEKTVAWNVANSGWIKGKLSETL